MLNMRWTKESGEWTLEDTKSNASCTLMGMGDSHEHDVVIAWLNANLTLVSGGSEKTQHPGVIKKVR